MKTASFKKCTNCAESWNTLEDFLSDPEVKLVGYQVHFEELEGGLFFFNHLRKNCYTTLAIPVKEFVSLSCYPILNFRGRPPEEGCPELCVRTGEMSPCPAQCECRWVREIMQVIRNWEKRSA